MRITKLLLALALCALAGIAIAQQDNRTPMGGKGDKDAYGQQGQQQPQQQPEDKSQQQGREESDEGDAGDNSRDTEEQPQ